MNPNDPQPQPILPNDPQPEQPIPPTTPSMEFVPPPPEAPVPTEQPIQMPPYAPAQPPMTEPVMPIPSFQAPQPEAKNKKDTLGIVSIICLFIGMLPVGFILGLVGASRAKKEKRSAVLSRTGWILNLVLILAAIPVVVLLVMSNFKDAQAKARDVERANDLGSIETSLEAYFSTNFGYPKSLDILSISDDQVLIAPNGSTIKVNDVASDEAAAKATTNPSGDVEYTYTPYGKPTCITTCDGYVLKALTEKPSDAVPNPLVKLGQNNL